MVGIKTPDYNMFSIVGLDMSYKNIMGASSLSKPSEKTVKTRNISKNQRPRRR